MFLDFYKLRKQPFSDTPDPHYVYPSRTHREALASLFYGIESGRGFLVLIAEPGMGKTTLLFHLQELLRNSARTAFVFQTLCDSRELLGCLLVDLGIDTREKEFPRLYEQLKEVLISEAKAGKRLVVFVDEAQNLDESALETVRLLSDFETPTSKLIQIVLVGQPQLADKLARPTLTQLRQRVSILSRLNPFGPAETDAYINHRLSVAGYEGTQLFTPEARAMIAAWSAGIPRNINNLCFNALSLGYALRRKDIDLSLVQEAASDLELSPLFSKQYHSHQPVTAGSPRGAVEAFRHELTPDVGLATIPDSIPAATCPKEPAAVPAPDSFGDDSFPAERVARAAEATPPSPPQLIRTSGDRRAWRHQLLRKVASAQQAMHYNLPFSFAPVLVGVIVLVIAAAGVFYLHRGIVHSAAATSTNPARFASLLSKAVNRLPGVRSADDPVPVVSQPLTVPRRKSQPIHQAQHSDASISTSQPASPESAGRPAWDGQNLSPEFFASLAHTSRWPAMVDRGRPHDRSAVASDAPVDTIQKIVPGDSNIPFALNSTLTIDSGTTSREAIRAGDPSGAILANTAAQAPAAPPVPVGGQVQQARLISSVSPAYPALARSIHLQGEVTIDALIDSTGKVAAMKPLSGPVALRQAAMDALRQWNYEPARLDGQPVSMHLSVTIKFRLN
jgi:TonB family protein